MEYREKLRTITDQLAALSGFAPPGGTWQRAAEHGWQGATMDRAGGFRAFVGLTTGVFRTKRKRRDDRSRKNERPLVSVGAHKLETREAEQGGFTHGGGGGGRDSPDPVMPAAAGGTAHLKAEQSTIVLISSDFDFKPVLKHAYAHGFRIVLIHDHTLQVGRAGGC